jgi:hypothetical protein
MGLVTWLKHAFAVDPPGPAEPTERQREIIDQLCREVVRRGMTTPALMALEMSRPLNYLGAQALVFLRPFIAAVTDADGHRHLAEFLEHRGSVEYLCRRIEELEANHERHETHEKP